MRPWHYLATLFVTTASLAALVGCSGPMMRTQSPESPPLDAAETRLIGDFTRPFGLDYVKVETAALVTGLDGTGEDPAPSSVTSAVIFLE